MTTIQAKAEVFLTAFGALAKSEQNAILFGLIHNASLREDIIDLTIAASLCPDSFFTCLLFHLGGVKIHYYLVG